MSIYNLEHNFDAVVMLTWSDWHREPRSNRYHYAIRFAKELPVIFVQPDLDSDAAIIEPVPSSNITILHVSRNYGPKQTHELMRALKELGVRHPLLWIYNVYFEHFIQRFSSRLKVYHATEDYLGPNEGVVSIGLEVKQSLINVLQEIDVLVSVSQGVADSYKEFGGYNGHGVVLRNGCDFEFWRASKAYEYTPPKDGARVVFFQGGINSRLDFALLQGLTEALPDWEFWFCGKADNAPREWHDLKKRPNVRDFGMVDSETIASLARQALVALIPFKQDSLMRRSLPLKAYEYVACGLPVVTIPIDELMSKPHLFRTASSVSEFASEIKQAAQRRSDQDALAERLAAAERESYDHRFSKLNDTLVKTLTEQESTPASSNILILYDDRSTHVRTIEEHLLAFQTYSNHKIFFMPATGFLPVIDSEKVEPELNAFDAIAIHYSIRLSIEDHLSKGLIRVLSQYNGPKLLFIQDEYDTTEVARRFIENLGIDAVFTNVPLKSIEMVYPSSRFPNVDFIPTLTGYVPEDSSLASFAIPLEERQLLIGYRGRKLPYQYGDLGFEKYQIGLAIKELAQAQGLPVDIEVDDSRRIYGDDWYRFLGSCRATLGTESGSNVFDFDGNLSRLAAQHSDLTYEEFRARFLGDHEGKVRMNQVSPKIFEAIRLRTALVLFEGEYSGVVQPHQHFIPLKKDYSNIDDVFEKLQDLDYLKALTDQAYRDVIESGRYTYEAFVAGVDQYLDKRIKGRARARIVSSPMIAAYGKGGRFEALQRKAHLLISDRLLGGKHTRENYSAAIDSILKIERQAIELQATADALSMECKRLTLELDQALNEKAYVQGRLIEAQAQIAEWVDLFGRLNATHISPSFKNMTVLIARRLWQTLPDHLRAEFLRATSSGAAAGKGEGTSASSSPIWLRLVPQRLLSKIRSYTEF